MKILMTACTHDEEGSHEPGQIVEMRDAMAEKYINEGWALPYKEPVVERAVSGAGEHATGKGQQGARHVHPPPSPDAKPDSDPDAKPETKAEAKQEKKDK